MEQNKTNRLNGYSLYIIFSLAVITVLVILIGVIISIEETEKTNEGLDSFTPAIYWEITKIEPNKDSSQNFDLTLQSNAGVIQNFNNVLSFGISQNGQYLAIHTDNGIEVVDLNNYASKKVVFEGDAYAGDSQEALSWSYDSNYFALGLVNTNNLTDSKIWVIDNNAEIVNSFSANLIVEQSDKVRVGNVYFSPFNKLILARTYSADDQLELKEDGNEYMHTELPVFLSVYNIDGQEVSRYQVRDFEVPSSNVYYQWDSSKEGFVKYGFFETEIDPNDYTQITRIKL